MFYKAMRTIRPGEELFVYYGDDYARFLGIQPFSIDSIQISTGKILLKSLLIHLFYLDDNNKINDNY
jgi:hypothetical protein